MKKLFIITLTLLLPLTLAYGSTSNTNVQQANITPNKKTKAPTGKKHHKKTTKKTAKGKKNHKQASKKTKVNHS